MQRKTELALLQKLVNARGPCGQEEEIRLLCNRELQKVCDDVWKDGAGNVVGFIKGKHTNEDLSLRVMAHMDELSMIVKRVEEDGCLRVNPMGGFYPYNYGQGMVDILGDKDVVPGVLSLGCMHVSPETSKIWEVKPEGGNKALSWEHVHIITRESKQTLTDKGIHSGTRVVIAQSRRSIALVNDCYAGYFFDNRVAITAVLISLQLLRETKSKPHRNIYVVMTTSEELGAVGALYASRTLPGQETLAVDVGPVAKEYGIELNEQPVIVYKDRCSIYNKDICDLLLQKAQTLKLRPQTAVFESYGSDASYATAYGQAARSALVCIPTTNTHGYEMVHRLSIDCCARLLKAYYTT